MNLPVSKYGEIEIGKLIYKSGESVITIKSSDSGDPIGIILKNISSDSVTATVKAGNSIFAGKDLEIAMDVDDEILISLKDIGKYINVYGEYTGNIVLNLAGTDLSDVRVYAFSL